MATNTRTCKNGHKYDASIYGENCPFCPSPTTVNAGGHTTVNGAADRTQVNNGSNGSNERTQINTPDSSRTAAPTIPVGNNGSLDGGHTMIRTVGGDQAEARRIVGLLVSFSHNPAGEVFNLHEGRNTIGRDLKCDISFPNDNSISSTHLVIAYREADGRFVMEDQLTSNGTWLNGKFAADRTTLSTNDVVVIGKTKFVFLAIPLGL